jgi:hypothetical protein
VLDGATPELCTASCDATITTTNVENCLKGTTTTITACNAGFGKNSAGTACEACPANCLNGCFTLNTKCDESGTGASNNSCTGGYAFEAQAGANNGLCDKVKCDTHVATCGSTTATGTG